MNPLIRADDFYFVPDPIGRPIYSAAVAARLHPLFDHFFTIDFELDLIVGDIRGNFLLTSGIMIVVLAIIIWHLVSPLSGIKIENIGWKM